MNQTNNFIINRYRYRSCHLQHGVIEYLLEPKITVLQYLKQKKNQREHVPHPYTTKKPSGPLTNRLFESEFCKTKDL